MRRIAIGGAPEHFNFPWHRAIAAGDFARVGLDVRFVDMPGGTGAMVEALRTGTIDVALPLTEGAVAAIERNEPIEIVGTWVSSPLIWGVHVAAAADFSSFGALRSSRFAISRAGSGSQLMVLVEARRRGWDAAEVGFVTVGGLDGARQALASGEADAFLWEKYTTRPLVHAGEWRCIDQVSGPWPAFVVACRRGKAIEVAELLTVVAPHAESLKRAGAAAIEQIAAFYHLDRVDVASWLDEVRWAPGTEVDEHACDRARAELGLQTR